MANRKSSGRRILDVGKTALVLLDLVTDFELEDGDRTRDGNSSHAC